MIVKSLPKVFFPLPGPYRACSSASLMNKNQTIHILIVDDSKDQQFLLRMLLESKGYTTDCTSNGEEALSLLRSSRKRPNTILLDLNMPVMDGYTFRSHQIADPSLSEIPVIVMSGEENLAETKKKTRSDAVSKPLNIGMLMAALDRSLQLH